MRVLKRIVIASVACLCFPPALIHAAGVIYLGPVFATDMSTDGSVVVGNTPIDYETFRWTAGTGVVPLGRATVPVLQVGAGTPDVSADGTRITGTILDDTGTLATQGLWTLGSGWQELMPPTPPDGGVLDQSLGSAWALSGDGNTVAGLYWRPGQPGGSAHASRWTSGTGVLSLGSRGGSSRVSGANQDGSVLVGFDEHPEQGIRQAAVWENGVRTMLDLGDNPGEAMAVSPDGSIVVGQSWNETDFYSNAAVWRKNGAAWEEQQLGVLPGTDPIFGGMSIAEDASADGNLVVGFNRYDFFGGDIGMVWTPETGSLSSTDWLAAIGADLAPNLLVTEFSAVSPDGSKVLAIALNFDTFEFESLLITVPEPGVFSAIVAGGLVFAARRRRHA